MKSALLEFFRTKKDTFVKQSTMRENYSPAQVDLDSGTYWPSTWDEISVEEIDWEAFEKSVIELEASFKEGGENAHRNPLNK